MEVGQVWRHARYYVDVETGAFMPKYLLVLAKPNRFDVVVRLLTSRAGRPVSPRCNHGLPYPSFYLGTPGGPLFKPTWLDLHPCEDVDAAEAGKLVAAGVLTLSLAVPDPPLAEALDCVANADDTTRRQSQAIRDQLGKMRS